MHKNLTLTLAGIGTLGAAVLFSGCGGSSFSKGTFGNYPNTLPYAYAIEPIAFYGQANAAGNQATIEGSGLQAASGGQAYITGGSAFNVITGNSATLPAVADPNGTGSLPLGFSAKGLYVDAANQTAAAIATVTSVAPGTSVVFRAALANGVANNTTAGIAGATLTSTDPQLTAVPGLTAGLPMSLNVVGGAFANATYSTGTGGTDTPFTIPAGTPTGLHTVIVTVTDSAGRVTATTFDFPVVGAADSAALIGIAPTPMDAKAAATILTATATITNPTAGATAQTTADQANNFLLFAAPGSQTVTVTANVQLFDDKGNKTTTQTQTVVAPLTLTAGQTVFPTLTVAPAGAAASILPQSGQRVPSIVKH